MALPPTNGELLPTVLVSDKSDKGLMVFAAEAELLSATKSGVALAPLFLAAVFALTGVAGFVALSRPFDATAPSTQVLKASDTQGAAPTTGDEPSPPRKPKPPVKLVVSLRSTPPGATVVVGNRRYGPTPLHVVWTGEEAAEGRIVTFRFELKNYRDLTLTQEVHGDRLEVESPPMEPLSTSSHRK